MKKVLFIICILLSTLVSAAKDKQVVTYDKRPEVIAFVDQLVKKHKQLDKKKLLTLFREAEKQEEVLERIRKPAEKVLNWKQYRPIFYKEDRIDSGVIFWQENKAWLDKAKEKYGVSPEIIVAILGVETKYGRITGRFNIFESLATIAFDGDRRQKFFKSELEQVILLAHEENFDLRELKGSYAGAMGMPQFISSSYRHYAVDFDGDGVRDLFGSKADVIGSIANYFKRYGWKKDQLVTMRLKLPRSMQRKSCKKYGIKPDSTVGKLAARGVKFEQKLSKKSPATIICLDIGNKNEYWLGLQNFYAITRYNHSSMYSMAVYQVGQEIKKRYQKTINATPAKD